MRDAQLLADFAHITRGSALILHHGSATNDSQIRNLRQVGQNLVLHAVSKKSVIGVAAEILKGKHRNRFGSDGSDDLLEARIAAQRIEHWIEPEKGHRNWYARSCPGSVRNREYLLQSIHGAVGFSRLRCHSSKSLDRLRTIERILLHWNRCHRFVDVRECRSLIAKRRTDQRETFKHHEVFWLFLNERLQFGSRLAITLDSGGMIAATSFARANQMRNSPLMSTSGGSGLASISLHPSMTGRECRSRIAW